MTNYCTRKSAEALFRVPRAEGGSNAEKLLKLRKGMRLRKRALRDSERTVRNVARRLHHPSTAARVIM